MWFQSWEGGRSPLTSANKTTAIPSGDSALTVMDPILSSGGTMGAVLALIQTGGLEDGSFLWWVEILTGVATIVIAVALILVAMVIIPLALKARSALKHLNALAGKDLRPILQHGERIGENVSQISTTVRKDVEVLHGTIVDAQKKVSHAADLASDRINQFSALMELVQEEAESLFVDSASIVRGVKVGAERLRDGQTTRFYEDDLPVSPLRSEHEPKREI